MATMRKRNGKWFVEVRKKGHKPQRATFDTKSAATAWAVDTERALKSGSEIPNKTFGDLLERYEKEVSKHKRGYKWEAARIGLLLRDPIAKIQLKALSQPHTQEWRDRRLESVSAASVRREWTLLSHACNVAINEWHWLKENPFKGVKRPAPPAPRDRRISQDEIDRVLLAAGYEEPPRTLTARVACAFLFAIETAMRAGEIAGIRPDNVHDRHVHLPKTKNGTKRDVPLSTEAKRLLKVVDNNFGLTPDQISHLFRKIKARAMLDDLHFHDTRREALSRLSKRLDVMQLAKVSGHRDLRILQEVYYAPKVEDLADQLE